MPTSAKRHPGINGIATAASRYLELCVAWNTVPKPCRFSFASEALDLFNQVFVPFLEFRQFIRRHYRAYIPNTEELHTLQNDRSSPSIDRFSPEKSSYTNRQLLQTKMPSSSGSRSSKRLKYSRISDLSLSDNSSNGCILVPHSWQQQPKKFFAH